MKVGSQIFELFGYPVDSWSPQAAENLKHCRCPFMAAECDGGGNRYSSGIVLSQNKKLQRHFPGKKIVQAGVCSLQLKPGQQPWIVCPRRLLNYRQCGLVAEPCLIRDKLQSFAGLDKGNAYSVWSEVKMKCNLSEGGKDSFFDYTFWVLQDLLADYITKTTALNLNDFLSEHCDEVNVLSGGYGKNVDPQQRRGAFAEIDDIKLFAGPVATGKAEKKSFSDIVKLGAVPDVSELWRHLAGKMPCARICL